MYEENMIWQEISIKVPWEYVEPISYLFGRYGRGLSVEDAEDDLVVLRTYLPNTSKRRMAHIEVGVNLVRILETLGELVVEELEEADWESAWKAHFRLLKVGGRLIIKPSWIDYQERPDEVVIELDPGMAFGTGYHPTTKMCLEVMEEVLRPGMEVLDLGTGSGILTIAAAKLGASSVLALDTDPTAVKTARKNFRASGLISKVRLVRGTLPNPLAQAGSFHLATSNISAKVIKERASYLRQALRSGGLLIVSGFMRTQHQGLEEALVKLGFSHQKTYYAEDWVALLLYNADGCTDSLYRLAG